MARNTLILIAATLAVAASISLSAVAAVDRPKPLASAKDLTPIGAEKAGNADGTIPAWDRRHHSAAGGLQAGRTITRIRTPTTRSCSRSPRPTWRSTRTS